MKMYLKDILNKGNQRSVLVKKNILFSFILQGVSILCSFLLLPITLHYLKSEEYGVWLTITSIITWFNVCDIGIGMGLKNKLGEALALEDYELGKKYVSVTYALFSILMTCFLIIFIPVNFYLDWNSILNIYTLDNLELASTVLIVVVSFSLNFIMKTIGIILAANQRMYISSFMGVIASIISLIIIWLLTVLMPPSLKHIALVFSFTPVLVTFIGSLYLFRNKYIKIKPNIHYIDFSYARSLVGLSMKFFVLQVSSIIVFTTANMIITQTIGPKEVTVYNICFKYFNIVTLAFNLLLAPMWPAYTNAYALGDLKWMENGIKRTQLIWAISSVGTVFLLTISPFVFEMWIGKEVTIPFDLSIAMAIYVIIGNWNNIYAQMLAGVGKVKLSLYNSSLNAMIFIPLSIYLSKSYGVIGVTIAMTLTILTSTFWQPIQSYKIIKGKAEGIWNK
jgi:O-antigen/teichoic acid export membrane protein